MVRDESDMWNFQEVAVHLENLGEVTVTVLSDEIEMGEIAGILCFGDEHVQQFHYVRVVAVLQEQDFSENSPSLFCSRKQVCDFFYCHHPWRILPHGFGHMSI